MNNDQQNNNGTRGLPFNTSFNIGTTIQSVFRNINHAFANSHDSGDQGDSSQDPMDDIPPLESLNSVGNGHGIRPTNATGPPDPLTPSVSIVVDAGVPLDSQQDDDEHSMPDLNSVSDSSDESDAGAVSHNAVPPRQDTLGGDEDHDSAWTDDEGDAPRVEPAIGFRRARVDDDGDEVRDRRHPSERVGGPPPAPPAPQMPNPQQPPRTPAGLFGALFGLGPLGGNHPGGDGPGEHAQPHAHTGEGTADPSSANNNATPPRGTPVFTAGFTFTIPLFGPPPANNGNRTGPPPAPGGFGGLPGMMGMDPAAREELLASFAAFFQEFQAMEEGREDPERAKKLLAGLEVVPLGLVKRLERVGGAPGGHVGDSATEGTSSGCAICWDTLLDGESDNFSSLQRSASETPQSGNQNETHTGTDAMDVDASVSHSDTGPSASASPSPEDEPKIIALPCAHVFHASCLVPWFTRARQATCPTCRFNIDPENLTYSPPPRRPFNRAPPTQPDNAANVAPADAQAAPQVPAEGGAPVAAAGTPPQVDPARPTADTQPATDRGPPNAPPPFPPNAQAGAGHGFNPFFGMPGIPMFSFPAIQIPLRPPGGPAPGDGNQGVDMLTIGLDMFVGVPPGPEERRDEPRGNTEGGDAADNGEGGAGAAGGDGAANPNRFADFQALIEGLLRATRTFVPANGQQTGPVPFPFPFAGPAPAPAAAPPADGTQPQPQPQAPPIPEAAGRQPGVPPMNGPRIFPMRPGMFRPTRPMPPRRERKTWTLPPAPGPSLRQRVEQQEREQGLRCSDTSCGVGPSDDDPYPEPSVPLVKQVFIHPLGSVANDAPVCAHAFHPECLVSAERVAGWGADKTGTSVEVSCPVCRAVGCVTREEWEAGVSAL